MLLALFRIQVCLGSGRSTPQPTPLRCMPDNPPSNPGSMPLALFRSQLFLGVARSTPQPKPRRCMPDNPQSDPCSMALSRIQPCLGSGRNTPQPTPPRCMPGNPQSGPCSMPLAEWVLVLVLALVQYNLSAWMDSRTERSTPDLPRGMETSRHRRTVDSTGCLHTMCQNQGIARGLPHHNSAHWYRSSTLAGARLEGHMSLL